MKAARTLLRRNARLVLIVVFAALLCTPSPALATSFLGLAQSFAVLGASKVSNTGATTINGDLGISPGPAGIVGFFGTAANEGPGTVTGGIHENDALAGQAQNDAEAAFDVLIGLPPGKDLSGQNLGGLKLTPGVYSFSSSAGLTGPLPLTLDFTGNPNSSFVFRIGSTLTTASSSTVTVTGGGPNSGVYWEVDTATLGTSTTFVGNILANTSITLTTGATILCGRAIALNAAVTMDTNTISNNCAPGTGASDFASFGFSGPIGGSTSPVPEPASVLLLITGLISAAALRRARAQ